MCSVNMVHEPSPKVTSSCVKDIQNLPTAFGIPYITEIETFRIIKIFVGLE